MAQVNPNYSMLETDSSISGSEVIPTQDATTLIDGKVTIDAIKTYVFTGITASATELNYLDITTLGTGAASKAVVLDTSADYTWPAAGTLTHAGTAAIAFTGTAVTKGINFAGATPAYADHDDAFIAVGTYNDAVTIANTSAYSFIPIQVNLSSTGNVSSAGQQVAAMRLRVDTDTNAQGNTAIAVAQLRSDLSQNCYAFSGISQSANISDNITISPGEFQVGFWQVTGAGNIICSTGNVSVVEARMAGTGTGVDYVGLFGINTAATIDSVIKANVGAGTVTNGVSVAGTMTNGINISGTMTDAITITNTATALAATCSAIGASGRTATLTGSMANGNLGDGYGAVELQLNATGTLAGQITGLSNWINVGASAVCGSNKLVAQDNGIYVPSAGTPMASAIGIIGMRMQYVAEGGENPGALHLFDTNIYSNVLTSLFRVNAIVDMGGSTGAQTGNDYKIPLFYDQTAGQLWYVNIYHS